MPKIVRYRRTLAVAVLSATVVVASVLGAGAGHAAPEPFSNGIVKATGIVARVAPGIGSLSLAITSGVAVSEIKNDLAQAQGKALDLGLLGSSLTGEQCDGGDPTLNAEDLPKPTFVDNRKGDASAETTYVPSDGGQFGSGRSTVRATTQPLSDAVVTSALADLAPLIKVVGGQAHATSRIIDGAAREAHATVAMSLELGDVVKFTGLQWDAVHRTGSDPNATAGFTADAISMLGVPLPADNLQAAEDAINGALAIAGITLSFPKVERFTEPADLVRISPLRITIKDGELNKLLVAPALDLLRVQKEQLFIEVAKVYCRLASILLVGDITLSALAGTGFIIFEVGGAEALSQPLVLENPFGTEPLALPEIIPPLVAPLVPLAPEAVAAVPPAAAPQTVARTGPVERVCESTHPFDWPACSRGAALPLGLAGLGLTAGVGFLDWRHQRRRLAAIEAAP